MAYDLDDTQRHEGMGKGRLELGCILYFIKRKARESTRALFYSDVAKTGAFTL